MHELHTGGLVKYALRRGGSIHPVIVPESVLGNQTGTMNPSIFVHKDKILMNLRHINYILYHSEGKKFPHTWGPLVYVHPQNDVTLTTYNVMCEFDLNLNLTGFEQLNSFKLVLPNCVDLEILKSIKMFGIMAILRK